MGGVRVRLQTGLAIGWALIFGSGLASVSRAAPQAVAAIPFISVTPYTPSEDYERADAGLADYLRRALEDSRAAIHVEFNMQASAGYQNAIQEVVRLSDAKQPFIARLTPYPCVVAELEGAKFEILATYLSAATNDITYNSYFVVKERSKPPFELGDDPGPRELARYLTAKPRQFMYHDQFSTSSYFIPLHFLQSQRIFDLRPNEKRGPDQKPITVIPPAGEGMSSSELVESVLRGEDVIAAVWDGTKKKFPPDKYPSLHFIRLDTPLPNDLLVVSSTLPTDMISAMREAIRAMPCNPPQFPGDFVCWRDYERAPRAREALAGLRRLAVAQPAPATIEIEAAAPTGLSDAEAARYNKAVSRYLEAARQAVRLAGTEFVPYERDYHGRIDVTWTLTPIHDGVLRLKSVVNGVQDKVEPQVFTLSFASVDEAAPDGSDEADAEAKARERRLVAAQEELTQRIVALLHTRMNRIRYLWPFDKQEPTVLRDVGFTLPEKSQVLVQRIVWTDRERNRYEPDVAFPTSVMRADFYKFQFDREKFAQDSQRKDLLINPMSNVDFRVILVPPTIERPLFRYLTVALVVLFALAGAIVVLGLARGLYRRRADAVAATG